MRVQAYMSLPGSFIAHAPVHFALQKQKETTRQAKLASQ